MAGATAPDVEPTHWLTVREAAARAKCSVGLIYLNVKQGRLRASRLGYRKDIRIRDNWLEDWMLALATPHEIRPAVAEQLGPLKFAKHGRKAAEEK